MNDSTLQYRAATTKDLPTLVAMLADDALGALRENPALPLSKEYLMAFASIDEDPNNELIVVELEAQIIGMLQLTFIPYLTHQGTWRCLIEGVRIHRQHRGQGVGQALFQWAIDRAKHRGCQLAQLTSDKQRPDAIRFYESLGFVASHEGFKLKLN
ncbi:ribosomal protein S18 acetylase RimI-like enzyme [Marinicella litoralis]|uniref:Ribosomal protein S18 acetylase RimI-like enzyme n=2 Tax=Marinicella litoralis TaxID=644220 RepID=A0A4R6Y3F4_9GAMM|nr:ribosomal protein S18 acetylase RimI-like enzyme [Marinicella litoralis]